MQGNRFPPAAQRFAFVAAVSLGLAALPVAAQDGSSAPAEGRPAERRSFDKVIGVIGDRVILQSAIDRVLAQRSEKLSDSERQLEERRIITEIARDEVWVQRAKVLGKQAPEAFEEVIQRQIDEFMAEQVSRYGSFTRMTDELDSIGTSWQALRDDYRQDLMRRIAQSQALGDRIFNKGPLLVTPREMLRFFREHPERFAARSTADVAWVSFPAGSEPHAARARALSAADVWRQEELTEQEIAGRFEAIALPRALEIRQDAEDARADFLKEFAASAGQGDVSAPLQRGPSYFVLKLVRKVDARARTFDDQAVQDEIHEELVRDRLNALNSRILLQNGQKLLVWPEWLLPRR